MNIAQGIEKDTILINVILQENSVDADMSGSESKIEAEALIASDPDPESRMQPYRRRRNK